MPCASAPTAPSSGATPIATSNAAIAVSDARVAPSSIFRATPRPKLLIAATNAPSAPVFTLAAPPAAWIRAVQARPVPAT